MKLWILLLFSLFSFFSSADELSIQCDDTHMLKTVKVNGVITTLGPESPQQKAERLLNENKKVKSLCATALKCLNYAKISSKNQDSIREISKQLNHYQAVMNKTIQDDQELNSEIDRLNSQIEACEIEGLAAKKAVIPIKYNFAGLNRNKNGNYEADALEDIVEKALNEGVDPYLALSILLIENPPSVGSSRSDSYRREYGNFPIDAIAAYDILNCYSGTPLEKQIKTTAELKKLAAMKYSKMYDEIGKLKDPELALVEVECEQSKNNPQERCSKLLTQQKQVPQLDLTFQAGGSVATSQYLICTNDYKATPGARPVFWIPDASDKNHCCANVKSNLGENDVLADFAGALGMKYLKKTIQDCTATSSATYCVQKYNGLGCFNCSEKSKNDCLNGIIMSDRPVYGARAMDLVVNSLMTNSEINKMILKVSRRMKRKVASVLCLKGSADQVIDTSQYYREQKSYLLEGDKYNFKFTAKTPAGRKVTQVDTSDLVNNGQSAFADEKKDLVKKYLEIERNRKKSCEKYYQ